MIDDEIRRESWKREFLSFFILDSAKRKLLSEPSQSFENQQEVLAIHWHPEFIPLDLAEKRLKSLFPRQEKSLVIPTEHNIILTMGEFAGVEVDCRVPQFYYPVQVLIHLSSHKLKEERSSKLQAMVAETFEYTVDHFWELLLALCDREHRRRREEIRRESCFGSDTVSFVVERVKELKSLLDDCGEAIPRRALRSKLIYAYFQLLRSYYDPLKIKGAKLFLSKLKESMKAQRHWDRYFTIHEYIEESRLLGGASIIPHPEKFWPILLLDLDVDGYEVWNPQGGDYTEFLMSVVQEKNERLSSRELPFLATVGDDTHLGYKLHSLSSSTAQDGSCREIGRQAPWERAKTRVLFQRNEMSRSKLIDEYRLRIRSR